MNTIRLTLSCLCFILVLLTASQVFADSAEQQTEKLEKRLKSLEPETPVDIQDPPWGEASFPTTVNPISTIIEKGTNIPFDVILNKPEYKRPAYEKHWHSTIGRWSYIPNRIHFALHRLFTVYDIGLSNWYDFEHNLGLTIPMFQNKQALDLYIVVFQTDVTAVYTYGNQVVVVGNPTRTGVKVITITTRDVHPANKEEKLLVQLATVSGHEIDYSLNSYMPPNFWEQQEKSR